MRNKVKLHNLEQCKKYLDEGRIIDAIECSANNNKITSSERALNRLIWLLSTLKMLISTSIYIVNINYENKNRIRYYISRLRKYGIQVLMVQNHLIMTKNSEIETYCRILNIHNCSFTYNKHLKVDNTNTMENLLKNLCEQKEKENGVNRT